MKALARWFDKRMPTIGAEWRKRAAAYYVFFILMPWYTTREKVKPVPDRVTV